MPSLDAARRRLDGVGGRVEQARRTVRRPRPAACARRPASGAPPRRGERRSRCQAAVFSTVTGPSRGRRDRRPRSPRRARHPRARRGAARSGRGRAVRRRPGAPPRRRAGPAARTRRRRPVDGEQAQRLDVDSCSTASSHVDPTDPVDVERVDREARLAVRRAPRPAVLHLQEPHPDVELGHRPGRRGTRSAGHRSEPSASADTAGARARRTASAPGSWRPRPGTGTGRSPRRARRRRPIGHRANRSVAHRHRPLPSAGARRCGPSRQGVRGLEAGQRVEGLAAHPHPRRCSGSTGPSSRATPHRQPERRPRRSTTRVHEPRTRSRPANTVPVKGAAAGPRRRRARGGTSPPATSKSYEHTTGRSTSVVPGERRHHGRRRGSRGTGAASRPTVGSVAEHSRGAPPPPARSAGVAARSGSGTGARWRGPGCPSVSVMRKPQHQGGLRRVGLGPGLGHLEGQVAHIATCARPATSSKKARARVASWPPSKPRHSRRSWPTSS